MGDSRVAGGLERLPWLADEPKPRVHRRGWDFTGWAVTALLLVAGVSFWLGSLSDPVEMPARQTVVLPSATVDVPRPRQAPAPEVRLPPEPQVAPVPQPEVREAPVPQVRIAPPPPHKAPQRQAAKISPAAPEITQTAHKDVSTVATTSAAAPKNARPTALTPWPPRVVAGAYGRLVQIGAYGSRIQAKRGWWSMARAYPAMKRLPAVVVETRNSLGRTFYRFQVGTTSQAHSEVLCQRMQSISLSCAVVGLPWKSRVER